MTADPQQTHEDDATDQGVSATAPAEGADDAPDGSAGSPDATGSAGSSDGGVITGETADER